LVGQSSRETERAGPLLFALLAVEPCRDFDGRDRGSLATCDLGATDAYGAVLCGSSQERAALAGRPRLLLRLGPGVDRGHSSRSAVHPGNKLALDWAAEPDASPSLWRNPFNGSSASTFLELCWRERATGRSNAGSATSRSFIATTIDLPDAELVVSLLTLQHATDQSEVRSLLRPVGVPLFLLDRLSAGWHMQCVQGRKVRDS
jgi:hypothetical protein